MMDKNVSIVIPTFNRAKYLNQCIESCLNQTISCEIIVCDHGCTDNTSEVLKAYNDKIIYIRREKDFGPHYCWLEGIMNARNNLIHIQYDDDWLENTFIEECLNLFDEETAFVFSKAKVYDEVKKNYFDLFFEFKDKKYLKKQEVLNYLLVGNLLSPGCAIFRKNILIDNLFINNVPHSKNSYFGVGPDALFALMSTNKYKKIGFVNKNLSIFRSHEGSISIKANSKKDSNYRKKLAYQSADEFYLINKFVSTLRLGKILRILYIILFCKTIYLKKYYWKKNLKNQ